MASPGSSAFGIECDLDRLSSSDSASMRPVLDQVRAVAPTRTTVLLTGETGCGKGLIARLIHHRSNRREMPFVTVHCGAIPDTLLESELFGHEKGAFTGAIRRKPGKFEMAQGGTLFLDEIGTVTASAQIKLLNVLQERSFQRVGGEDDIEVDVRLITATNSDLRKMMQEGSFRNDLYYRLNVFPIELPPLRKRREDIPRIVEFLNGRYNELYLKSVQGVVPEVLRAFASYAWPGNIREMENVLERAHILTEASSYITGEVLPPEIMGEITGIPPVQIDVTKSIAEVRSVAVAQAERRYLDMLLARHEGRIDATSRVAGITTRQLHKLMLRHGLRKEEYRPSAHRNAGNSLSRSRVPRIADGGAGSSRATDHTPD
jgi:transcriptional regulator with GAF, ATPase, and Fis domain